jgi:hypothetical protein
MSHSWNCRGSFHFYISYMQLCLKFILKNLHRDGNFENWNHLQHSANKISVLLVLKPNSSYTFYLVIIIFYRFSQIFITVAGLITKLSSGKYAFCLGFLFCSFISGYIILFNTSTELQINDRQQLHTNKLYKQIFDLTKQLASIDAKINGSSIDKYGLSS